MLTAAIRESNDHLQAFHGIVKREPGAATHPVKKHSFMALQRPLGGWREAACPAFTWTHLNCCPYSAQLTERHKVTSARLGYAIWAADPLVFPLSEQQPWQNKTKQKTVGHSRGQDKDRKERR